MTGSQLAGMQAIADPVGSVFPARRFPVTGLPGTGDISVLGPTPSLLGGSVLLRKLPVPGTGGIAGLVAGHCRPRR